MPIEDELYQERILDHYEEPFHRGQCPAATHAHEDENPLCGDVVRVELAIESDGTIRDAYFSGDGCCISQASASMLIERINGKPVEEVKACHATVTTLIKRDLRNADPSFETAGMMPTDAAMAIRGAGVDRSRGGQPQSFRYQCHWDGDHIVGASYRFVDR